MAEKMKGCKNPDINQMLHNISKERKHLLRAQWAEEAEGQKKNKQKLCTSEDTHVQITGTVDGSARQCWGQ